MRRLALALVMLLSASPAAHAVLITGRATGTITLNGTPPGSGYQFAPGEAVSVTFAYDPERSTPRSSTPTQQTYDVMSWSFRVTTGGGFTSNARPTDNNPSTFGFARVVNGPTDIFELSLDISGTNGIDLTFTDPTGTALLSTALPTLAELLRFPGGTLDHRREFRDQSFRSVVVPVADFPVPEPSTLALGAIGVGVLGLAGMRRRKGA